MFALDCAVVMLVADLSCCHAGFGCPMSSNGHSQLDSWDLYVQAERE